MAKLLKLRRGSTSDHGSFTGAEGEVTVDTTKDTLVVHDGQTSSGHTLLREDLSNLPAGQIDNADINASAAIAGTKISPDFGSQNIATTGNASIGGTNLNMSSAYIDFSGSISTPTTAAAIYRPADNSLAISTGNNERLLVNNSGAALTGNLDVSSGIDVTGDITTTGNLSISSAVPKIFFTDTGNNPDYLVKNQDGAFVIRDNTNNADRLVVQADGHVDVAGNLDVGAGIDVTGDSEFIGDVKFKSSATGRDITFDRSAEKLIFEDNAVAAFGDSSDLQIYHDGSNSRIVDGGTGNLVCQSSKFQVTNAAGTEEVITCFENGAVELFHGMGGNAAQKKFETTSTGVSVTGALVATDDITAFSDQTLKKDITTINDALGLCGKLRGVSYKWIKDDKPSIGVIAQEIEQHIPEIVSTTQLDGKDVKSVDYGKIVGVLINAVNELKAELDEYKDKYKELTTKDYGNFTEDQRNELTFLVKKEN